MCFLIHIYTDRSNEIIGGVTYTVETRADLGAGVNYLTRKSAFARLHDLATSLLQAEIIKKTSPGNSLYHQLGPFPP